MRLQVLQDPQHPHPNLLPTRPTDINDPDASAERKHFEATAVPVKRNIISGETRQTGGLLQSALRWMNTTRADAHKSETTSESVS